ncbi:MULTISPECIES: hypothetical protein [unclassified Streptomyces]|uniref:hypothetical protein n=1 Tax=unclassified Streptomyces TaxID=2593676 RepID=UPI003255222F
MVDTAALEQLFGRLSVLGAAAVLEIALLLLASHYVEPSVIPRRFVRRVQWWSTHGRAALAYAVVLTLGSLAGFAAVHA